MTDWDKIIADKYKAAVDEVNSTEAEFHAALRNLGDILKIKTCDHDFSETDKVLDSSNNWVEYNICTKCGFECLP